VRGSVIALIAAAALALALGFLGRATEKSVFDMIAGLMWLTVILVAVSLLPIWRKVIPHVPAMDRLFDRPGRGERWCVSCGSPAPVAAACIQCKAPARSQPKSP
jgi:hypothetical protein